MTVLGVGLVGASADYGWGKATHVPAVRAVPDLELRAVATRRQETADAASQAFEVAHAFGTVDALVSHPDVDIVSVVVRAPGHGPPLSAALRTGKHLYCEWPLGKDLADAEASARLAAAAGVHCAIGLQGRFSPWIRHIRDLVADGYVGRVLSTTLVVSDDFSIGSVGRSTAYMLDPDNGANPLSIHGGHFLDAFCFSLGELVDMAARTATSIPEVTVRETGETVASHVPDQIAVIGRLESGATAVAHIRAGRVPGDNLHWTFKAVRVSSAFPRRPAICIGVRSGSRDGAAALRSSASILQRRFAPCLPASRGSTTLQRTSRGSVRPSRATSSTAPVIAPASTSPSTAIA